MATEIKKMRRTKSISETNQKTRKNTKMKKFIIDKDSRLKGLGNEERKNDGQGGGQSKHKERNNVLRFKT